MNTNHTTRTTRTTMRALALTATLAGLLFGPPTIAFAGPSPTPAPPPPGAGTSVATTQLGTPPGPVRTDPIGMKLTDSNNAPMPPGTSQPLWISGVNFPLGETITVDIFSSPGHKVNTVTNLANQDGTFRVNTGCDTIDELAGNYGYARAYDKHGHTSNDFPLTINAAVHCNPNTSN